MPCAARAVVARLDPLGEQHKARMCWQGTNPEVLGSRAATAPNGVTSTLAVALAVPTIPIKLRGHEHVDRHPMVHLHVNGCLRRSWVRKWEHTRVAGRVIEQCCQIEGEHSYDVNDEHTRDVVERDFTACVHLPARILLLKLKMKDDDLQRGNVNDCMAPQQA